MSFSPAGPQPREAAIATIRSEHATLRAIVRSLQQTMHDVAAGRSAPDFGLLAAMLYYLDIFSESCHHPREDEFLFRCLRQRTTAADAVLDELQAQHIRSAQLMSYAEQVFVHYQGGAAEGLKLFVDAVDAYAALLSDHIKQEENQAFTLAEQHLTADDWSALAAAFRADHTLFDTHSPQEMNALKQRIIAHLPPEIAQQQ
jgi:hemerythrin-like domain-containing protein